MTFIKYREYYGSIEFDTIDEIYCGKVMGVRSLITYYGDTKHKLYESFVDAVNEYVQDCKDLGIVPEKSI